MSGDRGLHTAVEATKQEEDEAPIVQTSLFPAADLHTVTDGIGRANALKTRGRGRPAGSKNKKTLKTIQMIQQNYGDPLVFLAETYTRSVHDLAKELSCKPEEAFKLQARAASELAPYIHGKQPVAVKIQTELPVLNMVGLTEMAGMFPDQEEDDDLPDFSQMKTVEIQEVGKDGQSEVCQGKSVNQPETAENQGSGASVPLIADQSVQPDQEDGQ